MTADSKSDVIQDCRLDPADRALIADIRREWNASDGADRWRRMWNATLCAKQSRLHAKLGLKWPAFLVAVGIPEDKWSNIRAAVEISDILEAANLPPPANLGQANALRGLRSDHDGLVRLWRQLVSANEGQPPTREEILRARGCPVPERSNRPAIESTTELPRDLLALAERAAECYSIGSEVEGDFVARRIVAKLLGRDVLAVALSRGISVNQVEFQFVGSLASRAPALPPRHARRLKHVYPCTQLELPLCAAPESAQFAESKMQESRVASREHVSNTQAPPVQNVSSNVALPAINSDEIVLKRAGYRDGEIEMTPTLLRVRRRPGGSFGPGGVLLSDPRWRVESRDVICARIDPDQRVRDLEWQFLLKSLDADYQCHDSMHGWRRFLRQVMDTACRGKDPELVQYSHTQNEQRKTA